MITKLLYPVSRVMISAYVKLMLKFDIHWQVPLPKGPVLFAANHPSTTDPIFIHLVSHQPISVMIAAKVFSIPVLGPFMRRMQQIEVIPGKGELVLEQARRALAEGRSVAIFPEGAISPEDGSLHAPRSGVARLALESGVPVVPLGIYLSQKDCHRIPTRLEGRADIVTWCLRGPYAITVGKPLRFNGDANDRSLVKTIAKTVMEDIHALVLESQRRSLPSIA